MISVNMTLVVQGINFLVAFWFLSRFLLKPLVVLIEKKRIEKEAKRRCILGLEESIKQQVEYKVEQWRNFQKDFLKAIPKIHLQDHMPEQKVPEITVEPLGHEKIDQLALQVENFIVEKAGNVSL